MLYYKIYRQETKQEFKKYFKDKECTIVHREYGPAIEWKDGGKEWVINNKRHRIDGPAVEYVNGYKEWWVDGKLHREDGPAIERPNGNVSYYLYDNYYTKNEYFKRIIKIKFGGFV